MKNMNNKKLFAVLAAVTVLFVSCNNGLQTKNHEQPEGKARISFRIDDVSRNMKSAPITWDDIGKIVIKVKKYDTLANGEADSSKTPVQYCDDIFWMTTTVSGTNEISTAYDKLQTYEQEFDFGWYKFDLELYLDTSGTKQCYYCSTMESKIDSSTTQLTFRAIPTGTGDLSVKFCWDYYPDLPESADNLPIFYMEAGLYSDLACTAAVTGSELEKDFNDDYSAAYSSIDDPPYEISWNYAVQSIPVGTYYLKYTLYYTNYVYDEQTDEYLPEHVKLNSFVEEVRINNLGISETREFEQDDINKIPVIKGGFIFDSTLIDIESDSDNSDSDFYLNNGTITFRVKDHDTKEFIYSDNVSVQLYYGSQELDASYYSFDGTQTGTYGQPGFDYVFQFKLKEDKPLLTGGKYQLSIVATKPASATANTYGPFFYSSRTIDLDVKPQVYFEFNVTNKTASELAMAMSEKLKALRNDASIKIYGTPKDVELIEGTNYYKAKNYFSYISSLLRLGIKNNLVDLDMSQMKLCYSLDYHNSFQSCDSLRSIKLPASLHEISGFGLVGCQNLETIEFTIDDNDYGELYDIEFQDNPFDSLSSLEQFIITNPKNKQTNCFTLDDGKVLLSMMTQDTARIILVASEADEIALPLDGDVSVTRIEGNTFSYSRASVITGLNNVTTLASQAFMNYKGAASIYLPNVETINNYVFQGAEVNALTGLSKVTQIGDYAFKEAKIATITGLSNVTSVGSAAFDSAEIQTLDFGPKLSVINGSAFKDSKVETLGTNVTGITSIGDSAFEGSDITSIPDLSHLTSNLGSAAFKNCKNLQTVTVDEKFIDAMEQYAADGSFEGCITKNLIIYCDFILSYSEDSYSMSYTIDNETKTTSKISIIDEFNVTDTLTFNKKVTLPDLTYTNNPQDNTYGFFSRSQGGQGSSDWVGLAHLVFNDTSIIGKGQFNNFHYLSSIKFNDANNLSEIGEQAFWLNSSHQLYSAELEENTDMHKAGTRRPEDIVLNGVRKIGYQAINKVTEEGTLTIPESVLAIQGGAFSGIQNQITFAATSVWMRVQSKDKTQYFQNGEAEEQIDALLAEKPATQPVSTNPSETGESPNYYYTVYDDISKGWTKPEGDETGRVTLLPLIQEISRDYSHAYTWYYRWVAGN